LNTSLAINLWVAHYSVKSQLLWNRSSVRVNGERVFDTKWFQSCDWKLSSQNQQEQTNMESYIHGTAK
jgi:hypothetical protein